MGNQIVLKQKPIIEHQLKLIGQSVTERLAELNIDNLVANEDTVKSLKKLRATLNQEIASYEEQRKVLKTAILTPYNEFEELYKQEISDKYKPAIDVLKDKISQVENKVKEKKEENVKAYFKELCQAENIDFVVYYQLGLEINLSTPEKAYKDKCNEFINKMKDDIALIKTMEFEAEIMAEYKENNLNATLAIKTINDRKERERIEAERIKQIEWNNRIREFANIGMKFDERTQTFQFNDTIYVGVAKVKDISKEEFNQIIVEYDEKIKAFKKPKNAELEFEKDTYQPSQKLNAPVVEQPIQKPVEEKQKTQQEEPKEKLEIVMAKFEVKGTLPQLNALGQYMRNNGITYKNIE